MIYLGADHRGFALKEKVKNWLNEWRRDFEDQGPTSLNPDDDYTAYGESVAKKVQNNSNSFGILTCGSGVGIDIVANKYDGIRSSIGKTREQVKAGRKDDDMNILVIAADYTSEVEAKEMIKAFLETNFDNAPRHKKRLDDIKKIEENN